MKVTGRVPMALIVATLVAAGTLAWYVAVASGTSAPLLTESEAARLGIFLDQQSSAAEISAEMAVGFARSALEIDVSATYEIHHGRARQYEDSPIRSVWVVVFPGGRLPSWGPPPGSGPLAAAYRGMIYDDSTGEFLRGFMVGK